MTLPPLVSVLGIASIPFGLTIVTLFVILAVTFAKEERPPHIVAIIIAASLQLAFQVIQAYLVWDQNKTKHHPRVHVAKEERRARGFKFLILSQVSLRIRLRSNSGDFGMVRGWSQQTEIYTGNEINDCTVVHIRRLVVTCHVTDSFLSCYTFPTATARPDSRGQPVDRKKWRRW